MGAHLAISIVISAPNRTQPNRKLWIWKEECHCQLTALIANLAICWTKASGKSSKISNINNFKEVFSIISFSCNLRNSKVTKLLETVTHLHFIIIYKIEILVFHMDSHHKDPEPTYKKKEFSKLQAQNWIQLELII